MVEVPGSSPGEPTRKLGPIQMNLKKLGQTNLDPYIKIYSNLIVFAALTLYALIPLFYPKDEILTSTTIVEHILLVGIGVRIMAGYFAYFVKYEEEWGYPGNIVVGKKETPQNIFIDRMGIALAATIIAPIVLLLAKHPLVLYPLSALIIFFDQLIRITGVPKKSRKWLLGYYILYTVVIVQTVFFTNTNANLIYKIPIIYLYSIELFIKQKKQPDFSKESPAAKSS